MLLRFSRMLELEVTAGLLVITVAGILGAVSPPREDGAQRLAATQIRALLSPHLPTTDIANWADNNDSPELTIDDLHYSEFTHNWSGIAVCLLGMTWMAQGVTGIM